MRIPYKTRLLLAIGFVSALLIAGCVDTSVNPLPDKIEYSSQMKVVYLVSGAGQATLTLNGQSLGSAAFGSEVPGSGTDFLTIPSGSKTLAISYANAVTDKNQEYKFALGSELKSRVFIVGTAITDTFSISSVTKSADTIFVTTSVSNSLKEEQQVKIEGVNGMTDLNGMVNVLSVIDAYTFTILLQTSQNYTGGGQVIKTFFNTDLLNVRQRYVWQTKDSQEGATLFPDGSGWIAFFNGSPDAVLNSVTIDGTTTTFTGGLAMGQGKGYIKLAAGSHDFSITYNNNQSSTFTYNVASKGRYTAVVYDVATSIKNAVLVDD